MAEALQELESALENYVSGDLLTPVMPSSEALLELIRRVRALESGPVALAGIEKLDLRPGDVLIVRATRPFGLHERESIHRIAMQVLAVAGIADVGVFVADPDLEFTVARSDG